MRLRIKHAADADRVSFASGGGKTNVDAMGRADVVFLTFPTFAAGDVLSEGYDLCDSVANKLVISLLQGKNCWEIDELIDPSKSSNTGCPPPIIVTASRCPEEGLKVIGKSNCLSVPKHVDDTVCWLFAMVGDFVKVGGL
ncbi:hypothetical protein BDW74DRAFT_155142 [Aspergillus multicolor]|uniref:uncharacterized protein n=1 Tax=Aspergillus multicolor TaxID=41759 RepID=UPI003CCDA091